MHFQFKAYHPTAGVTVISLEAADLASARKQAETRGYQVLSGGPSHFGATPFGAAGTGGSGSQSAPSSLVSQLASHLTLTRRFSVALFGQELLALLEAGMGLVEAVSLLAHKTRHPAHQHILTQLLTTLNEGRTFSRALEGLPETFPALFVATIKAAEQTGNLPQALRRYLDYHRQLNALKDKITAAAVYPAILVLVGGLVVLFLLGYVIPRFSKVYEDLGSDRLPALSRWLMQWGQLASNHMGFLVSAFLGLIALTIYLFTRPRTRALVTQKLWQLPLVGEQLRVYQLARFTRTVAMLLRGGIPLVNALDMTDDLLRQPALQQGLALAKQALREGRPVAETFSHHGLATEVGSRLLVVGERSGELGTTMERIAAFYDEEIARDVEWLSRLFEPALMIFIGLLIGGIVILMYLPIFELASSIQ